MAHLVEIYKGLSKSRKAKPIQMGDIPKDMFKTYADQANQQMETRRAAKMENRRPIRKRPAYTHPLRIGPEHRSFLFRNRYTRHSYSSTEVNSIASRGVTDDSTDDEVESDFEYQSHSYNDDASTRQDGPHNPSKPDDGLYAAVITELHRPNHPVQCPLGLGLRGGADFGYPPIVTYLRPGSLAYRCDNLQVEDRLVSVNEIKVTDLRHDDVLTLLKNAGERVHLELHYDLKKIRRDQPKHIEYKSTEIALERENGSFGFTLRGGSYGPDAMKSRPLTITSVRPGGPADREGRLRKGDRLLAINNMTVNDSTLSHALHLLSEANDIVNLFIQYDVNSVNSSISAGPIAIEIEKLAGSELGVTLNAFRESESPGDYSGPQVIVVSYVVQASTADRCGFIHEGDQFLSIDGVSLEYTSIKEAYQLLRGSINGSAFNVIRLEILPCKFVSGRSQLQKMVLPKGVKVLPEGGPIRRLRQVAIKEQTSTESYGSSKTSGKSSSSGRGTMSSKSGIDIRIVEEHSSFENGALSGHCTDSVKASSVPPSNHPQNPISHERTLSRARPRSGSYPKSSRNRDRGCSSPPEATRERAENYHSQIHQSRRGSEGSVTASVSNSPCHQVCHHEVMEVILNCYSRGGYGLILHRSSGSQNYSEPVFISYIERGSPAEKSGVLQVGDRILAINDWSTTQGSTEEANYKIRHAQGPLNLTVEFDVIEAVLPSSGIFTVKLAKRGQSLGIVISQSPSGSAKGEPILVSDVKMGSVSHRCGSIHPGDQLLAIDNIPLDTCTVEEGIRLLQRASDIVKLRIHKNPAFLQEEEGRPQSVVYSVELSRRGGLLGVTIAGTDDRYDPIYISHIAAGGMADRTGALHVGDFILAINGITLADKKVSEATQMLQRNEIVNMKIERILKPQKPQMHYRNIDGRVISFSPDQYGDQDTNDKLGTPVQSIDSAVESLEDSPEAQNAGSNRNSQNSKSSSLSGAAAPISADGGVYSCEDIGTQLRRSLQSLRLSQGNDSLMSSHIENCSTVDSSCDHCHVNSQDVNKNQHEWTRILDALENVGEAEMLRKLEESIMQGSLVNMDPTIHTLNKTNLAMNSSLHSSLKTTLTPVPPVKPPFPVTNTILKHPYQPPPVPPKKPHLFMHTESQSSEATTSSSTAGGSNSTGGIKLVPEAEATTSSNSSVSHTSSPSSTSIRTARNIPRVTILNNSSSSVASHSTFCPPSTSTAQSQQLNGFHHANQHSGSMELMARYYQDIPYITSPLPGAGNAPQQNGSHDNNSRAPSSIQLSDISGQRSSESPPPYPPRSITNGSSSTSSDFPAPPSKGNMPLEIYNVTLRKDALYNDFGFSVSDGTNHKGVFVNKIRVNGPAFNSNMMRTFDRMLQVNDTSVRDLDCMVAVPLIASSGERIELLLCRDPSLNSNITLADGSQQNGLYTHIEEDTDTSSVVTDNWGHVEPSKRTRFLNDKDIRHTEV